MTDTNQNNEEHQVDGERGAGITSVANESSSSQNLGKMVWLEHGKTISNFFLKAFYSVVNWEGIEGTTIKRLYNKTILDTPITLPSFEEQEKIGNFFTVLDKVITLHQRE